MSNFWKSLKEWTGVSKIEPDREINRSDYSLVSCGHVTADTLRLWMDLPEEVKNDPELAPFKQKYEKEHGSIKEAEAKKSEPKSLHTANSAPILGSSIFEEVEFLRGKKSNFDIIEEHNDSESKTTNSPTPLIVDPKKEKLSQAVYYAKMVILLGFWVFFTGIFLMYGEREETQFVTSLGAGEEKNFTLTPDSAFAIKLSGPFLSAHAQAKLDPVSYDLASKLDIWIQRLNRNGVYEKSPAGFFLLQNSTNTLEHVSTKLILEKNDLNPEQITQNFDLNSELASEDENSNSEHSAMLFVRSQANQSIAFMTSYTASSLDGATGAAYACVLLVILYTLIITEVINRTMAAIIVSTMSLATLAICGERPSIPEVVSWLDEETLILLFSMMLLVAIMAETGVFDFLAVFTFKVTKGKLWPLIFLLCGITAVVSTFLDNVTTVLLMSPVTIRLCEVMELDPVPILMLMAIYSNVGGTATPVGDPPNVIVVSHKAVAQSGIHFMNFTAHMGLGILLVFIQTSLQVRFIFRDTNNLRLAVPKDIQDLTRQISIWRRAVDSLPHLSQDVHIVRERLERKISKLNKKLHSLQKSAHKRACPKDTFQKTLVELKDKYKIRDKALLIKSVVAITFVVTVFFLHAIPELNRVSLAWTALLGAILLLTLADRSDLEPLLRRVEWSTLLFFGALFVLMEALSKLGLILYIGGLMEQLILKVDENYRLAAALMLIIWVTGVISAFLDNIPLTTMMVRVVVAIGSNPALGLPMQPLIWALLFGACLGGNGNLIGASANVVCAGVAEQHGYKFTFLRFFLIGFPIMIGHLVVSSVYLLVCHCVFTWH